MIDASSKLAQFHGKKYLNVETYRRNGTGVRTPVWFAIAPADSPATASKMYVYTTAPSGKAKRIRQNGVVKIAPCDVRGNVTDEWINARAEIVSGKESVRGMQLIDRKYCPWKQILDLSTLLLRHHVRVVIAIWPV
jgi:PPOX class probable F420-dependent enzyme